MSQERMDEDNCNLTPILCITKDTRRRICDGGLEQSWLQSLSALNQILPFATP